VSDETKTNQLSLHTIPIILSGTLFPFITLLAQLLSAIGTVGFMAFVRILDQFRFHMQLRFFPSRTYGATFADDCVFCFVYFTKYSSKNVKGRRLHFFYPLLVNLKSISTKNQEIFAVKDVISLY